MQEDSEGIIDKVMNKDLQIVLDDFTRNPVAVEKKNIKNLKCRKRRVRY